MNVLDLDFDPDGDIPVIAVTPRAFPEGPLDQTDSFYDAACAEDFIPQLEKECEEGLIF